VTVATLHAARLDPRDDREWLAYLVSHSTPATYRGVRVGGGGTLLSGGTLPAPLAVETDARTILAILAADVVQRRPGLRLDAGGIASRAAGLASLVCSPRWTLDESVLVCPPRGGR
jgi:hypothetical protein